MTHDPFDPEAVRTRTKRRKVRENEVDADWLFVLKDPRGQRVLASILHMTGWLQASHVPGDPHTTAYREGQRSIGQLLNAATTRIDHEATRSILVELFAADVRDDT